MATKTVKDTGKERILDIGWFGKIDHYLSNLVPNGIVKISNGNSMIQFGLEIKNGYMREMIRQSTEMMRLQKELEMELVLKNKLSPLKANKFVLKHPVISQRLKADKLIKSNNETPKKHYSQSYVKEFEKVLCKDIPSEVEQMGIRFRELEFGESCVFDYYKHGRLLKQKINEHTKEIGLHLPRSELQVKINDEGVNTMTKMNIKNLEDLKIFYETANKLIKEPYQGCF